MTAYDDAMAEIERRSQAMADGWSLHAAQTRGAAMPKFKITYVAGEDQTDEEVIAGQYEDHEEWIDFANYDGAGRHQILRVRASSVSRIESVPS